MKNLNDFRIVKFVYPFPLTELEEMLWGKMTIEESKWAIQLTLKGINETGGDENSCWDLLFLDSKLQEKIETILEKYSIQYSLEYHNDKILNFDKYENFFSDKFLKKFNEYLKQNLTVDEILDNILKVGVENISVFEKYFLDNFNI
jgi:hypothetical protein